MWVQRSHDDIRRLFGFVVACWLLMIVRRSEGWKRDYNYGILAFGVITCPTDKKKVGLLSDSYLGVVGTPRHKNLFIYLSGQRFQAEAQDLIAFIVFSS